MRSLYELGTDIFEPLKRFWEAPRTTRAISGALVVIFLVSLAGVELKRRGLLPQAIAVHTPDHHFDAVGVAFSLVLILEVIGLVLALPCSFTKAMGKQFEILSLIFLRNAFKELVNLPEPIRVSVTTNWEPIQNIVVYGVAALIIFGLLGIYSRMPAPKHRMPQSPGDRYAFIASKKLITLALLAAFAALGVEAILGSIRHNHEFDFFDTFYTILVFADILLVLLSQRFFPGYLAVFRNSGYALATLCIRLALAAPPHYNAALGIGAALYAIALTWTFNRLAQIPETDAGRS